MPKPSPSGLRGQHRRGAAVGEDTSVRPGSLNAAKVRDGSPEDLRDPICVHAKTNRMRAAGRTEVPGLEETSDLPGAPRRDTNQEDRVDRGSEYISGHGCAVGSRSAFIVPRRAGNWARQDPKEGREASRGESHWRETREGTMNPAKPVHETTMDSRTG